VDVRLRWGLWDAFLKPAGAVSAAGNLRMMGTGEKFKCRGPAAMAEARKSFTTAAARPPPEPAQRLRARLEFWLGLRRFMAGQRVPLVTPCVM
jgi:hypothetical protein